MLELKYMCVTPKGGKLSYSARISGWISVTFGKYSKIRSRRIGVYYQPARFCLCAISFDRSMSGVILNKMLHNCPMADPIGSLLVFVSQYDISPPIDSHVKKMSSVIGGTGMRRSIIHRFANPCRYIAEGTLFGSTVTIYP